MPAPAPVETPVPAVNTEGRVQPWKEFITMSADEETARKEDFITIRANEGDKTGEFHDYASQLG
ncbi:Hypothetical protein R9X50_00596200 [Acrodontium crateriforme]|uniref:Uncharacterized protein n=1 Tax=Acrodontium crateriforme TaxID=150365 RepID=A0AAQ3M760_9PEZI|nr:Hypothetical protein R9X50_00596200 [Acrodontium crateriforme]